ncbi:LINE-1 reverse transcriptase [Sesamum angolense]|uniref:LINE-1 reverse transcriptase n=1 Tax=Sesamum angolense TaxID=2727404 RepID=A0AAE1W1A0_9LAMI|nr:LINE-1 reverse transcriptase [Sesamum angolense]
MKADKPSEVAGMKNGNKIPHELKAPTTTTLIEADKPHSSKGKEITLYNAFDVLNADCSNPDLEYNGDEDISGPKPSSPQRVETRVNIANVQQVRSKLLTSWSWFNDYNGPAGRIWLAWFNMEIDVEILWVDIQIIHCQATNKRTHSKCLISVLYGDCDLIPRRNLWATICNLADNILDEPWLVLGDFNAVIDDSEVIGRAADTSASMTEFRNCIMESDLIHLPFTGCHYTLHNCSEGSRSLWKRLDRMLVNEAWLDKWPNSAYTVALPSTSDHSPLILQGENRVTDHGFFRFDNYLAKQSGFIDSVNRIWRHKIHGTAMYEVVCKLKALKATFRQQRKAIGSLSENVKLAKGFLDKAQQLFTDYKEDFLLQLVKCCRMVYSVAVKMEEQMLHQRSKLQWLKNGDQNSKIFFKKINSMRAKQCIYQISTQNGEVLTDMKEVTEEFVSYFKTLLGGTRMQRDINLNFLRPAVRHRLTNKEADNICATITVIEIKEAAFDIAEDSAPGPDGYTAGFFKASWPVVGKEVSEAVSEFFRTGKLLKQVNATLLVLIPKVQMPSQGSDFRPISCCNVIYKIITKIIVKRMQLVLHLYNQAKLPPRCTIKVDLQKAYDSVEWDFLKEVLNIFNFPVQFIGWIEQCVSTASFSISLNGSIYGYFSGVRGLRQGDPMSPYLFVLVMEIWHSLLRYRVQDNVSFQYHWKCKEQRLLNLCFADDVLLFCKADIPSIQLIKNTLCEFAELSGLKVNPHKSQIILSRAVQQDKQQMIDSLGFQEGFLPIKYLGVPLISSGLTIANCRPLIDKLDSRIAGWNHLNLTFAGRAQLIRSVLSTLHSYWASVFILPKGIIKILEAKMRKFLWQGSTGRGFAKVAWDQGLQYRVGDGCTFRLWQDIWHEQGPLCISFPRGPTVTGLPLDAHLSEVLLHDQWVWPTLTDPDINEIVSHLPPICTNNPDKYSRRCLNVIQREVRFHWPKEGWQQGITWASKRWRSPHLINAASRALLAALVYHLWIERNNRKYTDTGSAAESVAKWVMEDIRLRIMSEETSLSFKLEHCIELGK